MVGLWYIHSHIQLLICGYHFCLNHHANSWSAHLYDPCGIQRCMWYFGWEKHRTRFGSGDPSLLQTLHDFVDWSRIFLSLHAVSLWESNYCSVHKHRSNHRPYSISLVHFQYFCHFRYYLRNCIIGHEGFWTTKDWGNNYRSRLLDFRYPNNFSDGLSIRSRNDGDMVRADLCLCF